MEEEWQGFTDREIETVRQVQHGRKPPFQQLPARVAQGQAAGRPSSIGSVHKVAGAGPLKKAVRGGVVRRQGSSSPMAVNSDPSLSHGAFFQHSKTRNCTNPASAGNNGRAAVCPEAMSKPSPGPISVQGDQDDSEIGAQVEAKKKNGAVMSGGEGSEKHTDSKAPEKTVTWLER